MSSNVALATVKRPAALGLFERYLTGWVVLCIIAGIVLGQLVPDLFRMLGVATVAEINLPVAVLIWLMIVPMLLKVDLMALGQVRQHWRGIGVTLFINWAIKPFSMALLGWLFVGWLFRDLLPAAQIDSYIAGLILLAAAPCTAMVFVWSHLIAKIFSFWRSGLPVCWSSPGGEGLSVCITLCRSVSTQN
jgi:arsenite transporter